MKTIIEVSLKQTGKSHFFYADSDISIGDYVVAKTSQGLIMGKVVMKDIKNDKKYFKHKLKKIVRKATKHDFDKYKAMAKKEEYAFEVCKEQIKRLVIPMKLIKVESMFDNSKIIFYFTADGRVDFRDLVKILATIFKTRIELRQVGVRDKAKLVGGLGSCGRDFCCKKFLYDFQPVSIRMAKEQGISLSPGKVSGICGRLMCCLTYEQKAYEEMLKDSPKVGAVVETEDGKGIVTEINLLKKTVRVSLSSGENLRPKTYNTSEVKIIRDAKITLDKKEIEKLKALEGI